MADSCCICLDNLDEKPTGNLKSCGHKFHISCIRMLYFGNIFYHEGSKKRIHPKCPLCRIKLHRYDIPGQSESTTEKDGFRINPDLINEPAHVSLPAERRLSRHRILMQENERKQALDRLIAERERLKNLRASSSETNTNVIVENIPSDNAQERVNSWLQQSFFLDNQPPNLQSIQALVYLVQDQLNVIEEETFQQLQDGEDVTFSDDEEDEVVYYQPNVIAEPVEVNGHWGLGRHTKYSVLWSDGVTSLNPTREVEAIAQDLLQKYRRKKRAENTRRCRALKKLKEMNS